MDAALRINGQQNYQVWQNPQQPQPHQLLRQAGSNNLYPQYSDVNGGQSAQLHSGYGAYSSVQTSNHQTSTTSQQLPTNTGYIAHRKHCIPESKFQQCQAKHPYQISISQASALTENWITWTPPTMAGLRATIPVQNKQKSVSNPTHFIRGNSKYQPENIKATGQQNANKESYRALTSTLRWKHPSRLAKHSQTMSTTRKEEQAIKNQPPTPDTASSQCALSLLRRQVQRVPSELYRIDNATFDSIGQPSGSQLHLQHQRGIEQAHRHPPAYRASLSNNIRPPEEKQTCQTSHLVNASNTGRNPPLPYASYKAVAVVQPLLQEHTEVTPQKSCPETIFQQKDTLIGDCIGDSHECDQSKTCSDSDPKDQINANEHPDNGTETHSQCTVTNTMEDNQAPLLSKDNLNEAISPSSVTLEADHDTGIQNTDVQDPEPGNDGLWGTVPVIAWTYEKLTMLIAITSKVHNRRDHSEKVLKRLVEQLWDDDFHKLLSMIETDYYKVLLTDIKRFFKGMHNSPILSQVLTRHWPTLKENFTVLDHDAVYFEAPYVSPWLNVNKQLDDIDKEFGFPSYLKDWARHNTETEPMETNCGILDDLMKGINVVVEDAIELIIQTRSSLSKVPDDTFKADLEDPLDLLNFEMMSPDQAEFKSNDAISTPEKTFSKEIFCCINKWIEAISETNRLLSTNKCCCKLEPVKPSVIATDVGLQQISLDPTEEENTTEVSLDPNQSSPSEFSTIIELGEELEVPQKEYANSPVSPLVTVNEMNVEEEIVNAPVSPLLTNNEMNEEEEMVNPPVSPTLTDNEMSEEEMANAILILIGDSIPVVTIEQKQSNSNLHLKSINSSLTTEPTRLPRTVESKDDYIDYSCRRKKRQAHKHSIRSVSQPALKDRSKNKIKDNVVADDSASAREKETVRFTLFGSSAQSDGVSTLSQCFSGRTGPRPPPVLTLTSSSVRQRLYEEWRRSSFHMPGKKRKYKDIRDVNQKAEVVRTERRPASPEQGDPKRPTESKRQGDVPAMDLTQDACMAVTKERLPHRKGRQKTRKHEDRRGKIKSWKGSSSR